MKLVIFGATGTIGRHLTTMALEHGHDVTAFARHPETLQLNTSRLIKIAGDVMDADAVNAAVKGHDAVFITLGGGLKGQVRSIGTKNVVAAMEQNDVMRLVCQSTLGCAGSRENLNFFWKYLMFGLLLRAAFVDHEAQEAFVTKSNLDWTIVRPAAFTDGPKTEKYRHGFAETDRSVTLKISRADVADFLLAQLKDSGYLHKTPGLSY